MLEVDPGAPSGAATEMKFVDVATRTVAAQKVERALDRGDRGVKIKKFPLSKIFQGRKQQSDTGEGVPQDVNTSTYVNPAFQNPQQQHTLSQYGDSSQQQQYFQPQGQQNYHQQQPIQPPPGVYQHTNGTGQYTQPPPQPFFPPQHQPISHDNIQPLSRAFTYAHDGSNGNYTWDSQTSRGMDAFVMGNPIVFGQTFNNDQNDIAFLSLHRRTMSAPVDPTPTNFRNPITEPFLPLEWCIICHINPPNARFTICGHGHCTSCDPTDWEPENTDYCDGCIRSQRHLCLSCKRAPPSPTTTLRDCRHGYCGPCASTLPIPEYGKCSDCRTYA